MRLSTTDGSPDGWPSRTASCWRRELKALGVDVIDCSSGGFDGYGHQAGRVYQVPFAKAVRAGAGIPTMAVGLISDAAEAEAILADGEADLIALARGALDDPNWPSTPTTNSRAPPPTTSGPNRPRENEATATGGCGRSGVGPHPTARHLPRAG